MNLRWCAIQTLRNIDNKVYLLSQESNLKPVEVCGGQRLGYSQLLATVRCDFQVFLSFPFAR